MRRVVRSSDSSGRFQATGEGEIKNRSAAWRGFHPDSATIVLDYTLADCETESGAGVAALMQPRKGPEDSLLLFGCDPDPVVLNQE